jgi:hypothetical protein
MGDASATCSVRWVPPCAQGASTIASTDHAAFWLPILLWCAWAILAWVVVAVLWRRGIPIRLGVFIGLVALTGLAASIYVPATPLVRLVAFIIGASFLVGEVIVIYREGARRDREVAEDRNLHEERQSRILTAFTESQQSLSVGEQARTGMLRSLLDTVSTMAGDDRAALRQETWRLMSTLSDISARFHRTKLAIEQEPLSLPGSPGWNPKRDNYGEALKTFFERTHRVAEAEQKAVDELYHGPFQDFQGIVERFRKYGIEDPRSNQLARQAFTKKLGDIDDALQALSEMANRLSRAEQ